MMGYPDLGVLRAANIDRLPQFKNRKGERAHDKDDGSDWPLSSWGNAALGEIGEAANLIKKIERGDTTLDEARAELGKEFADVLIHLDLLAFRFGVDLAHELGGFPWWSRGAGALRLSTLSLRVAARFGTLAAYIDEIERGGWAMDDESLRFASRDLRHIVIALGELAFEARVDMAEAVSSKFNEVSVRVGASTRITANSHGAWSVGSAPAPAATP